MKKLPLVCLLILSLTMLSALAAETTYSGFFDYPLIINTPGDQTIVLDGLTINESDQSGLLQSGISIEAPTTSLTIILKDGSTNYLSAATGIANHGIDLTIRCESAGAGHICNDQCGRLKIDSHWSGAAIGGEYGEDMSGTLRIQGGKISAYANYSSGAGIGGGGKGSLTGNVYITGGRVFASGEEGAAGIGGGKNGNLSGTVTITGGSVSAMGQLYDGAGIGGGVYGDLSGTVTITGGSVYASGGWPAAGIGGGYKGDLSGTVLIRGGTVTAIGNMFMDGLEFMSTGKCISKGNGGNLTGSVILDPLVGKYEASVYVKWPEDLKPLEGTPFTAKTDLTNLISDYSYLHLEHITPSPVPPATPVPSPAPAVPQTGDSTPLASLVLLAAVGVIGMAMILRKKQQA